MKSFCFILFTTLLLISCSKSEQESTSTNFNFAALSGGIEHQGGLIMIASQVDGNHVFMQNLSAESRQDFNFPNGQWEFMFMRWDGDEASAGQADSRGFSTQAMKGQIRCEFFSARLDGLDSEFDVVLDSQKCPSPKEIQVNSCASVSATEATLGNCLSNAGKAKAFRVFYPSMGEHTGFFPMPKDLVLNEASTWRPEPQDVASQCFSLDTDGDGSSDNKVSTGIFLPTPGVDRNLPIFIGFYMDDNCEQDASDSEYQAVFRYNMMKKGAKYYNKSLTHHNLLVDTSSIFSSEGITPLVLSAPYYEIPTNHDFPFSFFVNSHQGFLTLSEAGLNLDITLKTSGIVRVTAPDIGGVFSFADDYDFQAMNIDAIAGSYLTQSTSNYIYTDTTTNDTFNDPLASRSYLTMDAVGDMVLPTNADARDMAPVKEDPSIRSFRITPRSENLISNSSTFGSVFPSSDGTSTNQLLANSPVASFNTIKIKDTDVTKKSAQIGPNITATNTGNYFFSVYFNHITNTDGIAIKIENTTASKTQIIRVPSHIFLPNPKAIKVAGSSASSLNYGVLYAGKSGGDEWYRLWAHIPANSGDVLKYAFYSAWGDIDGGVITKTNSSWVDIFAPQFEYNESFAPTPFVDGGTEQRAEILKYNASASQFMPYLLDALNGSVGASYKGEDLEAATMVLKFRLTPGTNNLAPISQLLSFKESENSGFFEILLNDGGRIFFNQDLSSSAGDEHTHTYSGSFIDRKKWNKLVLSFANGRVLMSLNGGPVEVMDIGGAGDYQVLNYSSPGSLYMYMGSSSALDQPRFNGDILELESYNQLFSAEVMRAMSK